MTSILTKLGKAFVSIFKWLTIAIIGVIAIIIIIPFVMTILGYRVNANSSDIAELAVKKKDVSLCASIINYGLLNPQSGESRAHCVYTYAKISHDPTVCSLLLPSEYGLACISDLWLQATPGEGCGWNVKDDTIFQCRHRNDELLLQGKDCKLFIKNEKQFSRCTAYFAQRNQNLEGCKEIPDSFIRSLCEARINAWLKYPELRNSFYFGTLKPLPEVKPQN